MLLFFSSILSYQILFCSTLSYPILFYSILSYSILFYLIQIYSILFYLILSNSIYGCIRIVFSNIMYIPRYIIPVEVIVWNQLNQIDLSTVSYLSQVDVMHSNPIRAYSVDFQKPYKHESMVYM